MNAELKAKWVEALRSGKYQQGRGFLCRNGRYCCLGVLCENTPGIVKIEYKSGSGSLRVSYSYREQEECSTLPYILMLELGLTKLDLEVLVRMNDSEGKPFAEIADFIEKNL